MDEDIEIKRVLHIVSSMDRGGAETLIMNVYRNIDRTKVQFDFVTHNSLKGEYDDEIKSLGGFIYSIPSLGSSGPFMYIKNLVRIMRDHRYVAIHAHTDYQSGFPALAARLSGIKKRISHSHSTGWPRGKSIKERIALKLLQSTIKASANQYCSCSIEAARFLYGEHSLKRNKVSILKNGIDLKPFESLNRKESRSSVIQELQLTADVKILGHVGRFSASKNQAFILNILEQLVREDKKWVVLFIGNGPLQKEVEEKAEKMNLLSNIKFLGVRTDVSRLMNAMDVFLFPSKFEGFGIAALEAQCAGTPCVLSDAVPRSTEMGMGLVSYLNLNAEISSWTQAVNEALMVHRPRREMISKSITNQGYSITGNLPAWMELYGIKA
ncbi:glycosyltransferase family 1 protein [Fictibacillus fluitans]|uniref:Glycosyltransferase family 1 protein n=1 Tax=Fictibacillus fluitans TaxID=3058422 RepID=A0ABT8I165_9BACL|nr:glycosyltransferase family 1 protein [Fictibacillus sp. NE201]MDN4526731.1 glycosyltransferase family 1 protein [Fictibacillus sp. NE201]